LLSGPKEASRTLGKIQKSRNFMTSNTKLCEFRRRKSLVEPRHKAQRGESPEAGK
jgi:hypothetical protein